MTKEELIRMADQAFDESSVTDLEVLRFAALIAAHEREACHDVCMNLLSNPNVGGGWSDATIECAVQIAARKKK